MQEGLRASGLQKDVIPPIAAEFRDGAGLRAEHLRAGDAGGLGQDLRDAFDAVRGFGAALGADDDPRQASERRIHARPARLQFVPRERFVIVLRRQLDREMFRLEGLDEDLAALGSASRAAGDLHHELKRPLVRAEVRQAERRVRVDDADDRHVREVQALGDHLRAEEDVDLSFAEGRQDALVPAALPHGVGVHPPEADLRELFQDFLFDALRSHAPVIDALGRAGRAPLGRLLRLAAPVALCDARFRVVGHADVAVGAPQHPTAAHAEQVGRPPAPVEEEDGLLALSAGLGDGRLQRPREDVMPLALGRFLAHVHDRDGRHGPAADPLRQPRFLVMVQCPAILVGFEARRRASQDDRDAHQVGPHDGHVARMVSRGRLLLERVLMFLVDDDEAQVADRCEDGASGADDDVGPALGDVAPLAMAFGVRQVRVEDGHLDEPLAESADGLRRQGDLGHQDDRLPPARDNLRDCP